LCARLRCRWAWIFPLLNAALTRDQMPDEAELPDSGTWPRIERTTAKHSKQLTIRWWSRPRWALVSLPGGSIGSVIPVIVVVLMVVFGKDVAAEVPLEVAPCRVDVVGVVLGVGGFHEKGRTLHTIVPCLAPRGAARPAEADLADPCFFDLLHV